MLRREDQGFKTNLDFIKINKKNQEKLFKAEMFALINLHLDILKINLFVLNLLTITNLEKNWFSFLFFFFLNTEESLSVLHSASISLSS